MLLGEFHCAIGSILGLFGQRAFLIALFACFDALAADTALAYGARMVDGVLDGAQYAGDRIEDLGESTATTARGLRRDAAYKLDVAGDALRASSRKAGRKGSRAYRSLRTRITH